jgi:hypothetical protein
MTTGNKIVTKTIQDVTYIPLESVQTGADSIPFVYMKNKTRQVVVLGEANENHVIVEQGIEPGVQIFLSTPEEPEGFKLVGEELIAVIKEREAARKAEEERLRREAEKEREMRGSMFGGPGRGGMQGGGMQGGGMQNITPEQMQRFQQMRGGQAGQAGQGNVQVRVQDGAQTVTRQGGDQTQSAQPAQGGQPGQGQGQFSGQQGQGGRTRDTAAMRRMMQQRMQDGTLTPEQIQRFQQMQQQGGQRDTTRRRGNQQQGQQGQVPPPGSGQN